MMPPALRALMERYCTLGRLLPRDDTVLAFDPAARSEARMVLDEMGKVEKQITAMLAAARLEREAEAP